MSAARSLSTELQPAADIGEIDSRARRNMRCLPRCWSVRRTRICSVVSRNLRGDASTARARACRARRRRRADTNAEQVEREYFDLFIGVGRGELLPYGSYYLTGFLHERPLARLRWRSRCLASSAPKASRIRRITSRSSAKSWPGFIGKFPAPAGRGSRVLRKAHESLVGRFFADLEQAEAREVLSPRRHARPAFIEIETGSFRAAVMNGEGTSVRNERRETAMKQKDKATVGRREFLRTIGAGAGAARRQLPCRSRPRPHADTSPTRTRRRRVTGNRSREDLLSRQQLSTS